MSPDTITAVHAHAARDYPREACGVVVVQRGRERYIPCRNVAESAEHFVIEPEDYARAEDMGEVTAIAHSHPNGPAAPSQADLVSCETSGLPWLIVGHPNGAVAEISPSGYRAPLVGRQFVHGVLDCYSIVRDHYQQELRLDLPDFERPDLWWEKGGDLYRRHLTDAGFVEVDRSPIDPTKLRQHDVIIMQIGSPVPNHAAVHLGGGVILQHLQNRLSSRDIYGGYWQKNTRLVVRHRSLA